MKLCNNCGCPHEWDDVEKDCENAIKSLPNDPKLHADILEGIYDPDDPDE